MKQGPPESPAPAPFPWHGPLCSRCGQGMKPQGHPAAKAGELPSPPLPVFVPSTERKRREALEKEKERLQNIDEDEYDAMTEEEKIVFNREVQQALRERKKRSESRARQGGSGSPGSNPQSVPEGWVHLPGAQP